MSLTTPTGTHNGRLLAVDVHRAPPAAKPSPSAVRFSRNHAANSETEPAVAPAPYTSGTILLDENGLIALHTIDDTTPFSMKIDAPSESVERCVPHLVPYPHVTLRLTAQGDRPAELDVSCSLTSPHQPAYDILYTVRAPPSPPHANDTCFPEVPIVCSAVVPNPTHLDLTEIQLCLIAGEYRKDVESSTHDIRDGSESEAETLSSASSKERRDRVG